ncbi:5'-3' exonuclease H3TH domain-containing protein [Amycolatopsis sp. NPDC059021]|uniref:5'-3' exonuclease n=1 Tax=Amycolatopsis sp. NPDC059021 TaxID=3346704 RepID=UPI00366C12FC
MPATAPPRLYVDGHNLLHRAAFGFPARITSRSGRDITLVFGFFALMRAGARSLDTPPEIVVVFDGAEGATERRTLLPDYKPPVTGDEEAFADLPYIYKGLELLDIPCVEELHHEADDIIASFVTAAPDREHVIMSTDKDFYQLLSSRVSTLNTQRRADRRRIYPDEVYDKYRVMPHQWCDYRALMGDKSDNIPGVRGVGGRTASRLLADGAHLEDLAKLDRLIGRIGASVRDSWDDLLLWRSLIQLRTDTPVPALSSRPSATTLVAAPEIVGELGLWA